MSLLSKLFGRGGATPGAEPQNTATETYKGFQITATPEQAPGGWRIGARIEREVDGSTRTHSLIRADVISDRTEAESASIAKARMMVDQQGDRLFDD